MPRIVEWYARGLLNIDGLITRQYVLEDINRAYEELESDATGRGVIVF
jgi:S-(hydroxymethyl)glutathione dehydrogenase/alcohol dehydrogenase